MRSGSLQVPGKLSRLQVTTYRSEGEQPLVASIVRSARATRTRHRRIHNERRRRRRYKISHIGENLPTRSGRGTVFRQMPLVSFLKAQADGWSAPLPSPEKRKDGGRNRVLQHPDGWTALSFERSASIVNGRLAFGATLVLLRHASLIHSERGWTSNRMLFVNCLPLSYRNHIAIFIFYHSLCSILIDQSV